MEAITQKLAANPLKTREDAVRAVLDIFAPLQTLYTPTGAGIIAGHTGAHYGDQSAHMEGWARGLWALGPLWAGDNSALPADMRGEIDALKRLYRKGLVAGTDPASPGYWGDMYDFDQKMVETAALAVALTIAPDALWEPLSQAEKDRVADWMDQINRHGVHPNNWRFFRILTNMAFESLGLPVNEERVEEDFAVIDACYAGDGWYWDGNPGQLDYYIPFAMHFYGLIWAARTRASHPERAAVLLERARLFAPDFLEWFSDDGAEVPFGRSLTYRFAHIGFFSALAFAGVDALPWGQVRRVVMQNLRFWLAKPIFDNGGVLSIGYGYPNLLMSERYNAPGSPYWALKAFLFLALAEDHPFWQAEEAPLPERARSHQPKPHALLVRDRRHLMFYTAGQHCQNHGNSAAKYEKFVYSNRFGFSVSRGTGLDDGAFDNTIAISRAGENVFRMRYGTESFNTCNEFVCAKTCFFPGTRVESWIVPDARAWHVRVHRIETESAIDVADGGFALSIQAPSPTGEACEKYDASRLRWESDGLYALFPWGHSGVWSACPGSFELVRAYPNTNLFQNATVIPTFRATLPPGTHLIVTAFYGDPFAADGRVPSRPSVRVENGVVLVGDRITVETGEVSAHV